MGRPEKRVEVVADVELPTRLPWETEPSDE
jgi:hypothetical protein